MNEMSVGHKLTQEMLLDVNDVLVDDGTNFRVKWDGSTGTIVLSEDIYFDPNENQSVRPNDKFYQRLEELLESKHGLTGIGYNNTRTTFWCIGENDSL